MDEIDEWIVSAFQNSLYHPTQPVVQSSLEMEWQLNRCSPTNWEALALFSYATTNFTEINLGGKPHYVNIWVRINNNL